MIHKLTNSDRPAAAKDEPERPAAAYTNKIEEDILISQGPGNHWSKEGYMENS